MAGKSTNSCIHREQPHKVELRPTQERNSISVMIIMLIDFVSSFVLFFCKDACLNKFCKKTCRLWKSGFFYIAMHLFLFMLKISTPAITCTVEDKESYSLFFFPFQQRGKINNVEAV